MEIEELWAEVTDFPDYAVSNHGYIRNVRLGHDLRPNVDSYGYLRITLSKDGVAHYRYLHQIVAQHFLTGWFPGVKIKHVDENRGNCHVGNLRFMGRRLGHLRKVIKEPTERKVRNEQLDIVHRNARDAAKYVNGDLSTIYKVLRGERATHMGYSFVYFEEKQIGA